MVSDKFKDKELCLLKGYKEEGMFILEYLDQQ